jgi:putative ABC transport system permease protein
MKLIRASLLRLAGMFNKQRRDRELDDELASHLELHTEHNIRRGMSPSRARRVALISLGGLEATKERYRDRRGFPLFDAILQDLRYAARMLRKNLGFTATAILVLALAIGADTAIFSVIEAVLLRPLPYKEPARLVRLTDPEDPSHGGFLYKDLETWRSQTWALQDIAVYYRDGGWSRVTLTADGESEFVQGGFVSASFFPLLGISPALGRTFDADEEAGGERLVLLSHGLWVRRFGASPQAIGKTLRMAGYDWEVIGVMPATFQLPFTDTQFWAPLETNSAWNDPALRANTDPNHSRYFYARWQAIARLRAGIDLTQAQNEMNAAFARVSKHEPDPNRGRGVNVAPLRVHLEGNTRLALAVLFAAVSFVLLIACANIASLMLAQAAAREREMVLRNVLGAGRSRLVRQAFTEAILLALLCGCGGLVLAHFGVVGLVALAPPGVPRLEQAGINPTVLTFTVAICLLAAVLFGLVPALKISRPDPNEVLKSGGGLTGSPDLRRTRAALIVMEVALAIVLLTGTGLLVRSYLAIESLDLGFRPGGILTIRIAPPSGTTPANVSGLYDRALDSVCALPGVESAGAIDGLFELDALRNLGLRAVEGREPEPLESWTPFVWQSIRGDYFQAMGTPLLHGRYFSQQDGPNAPLVAIVDESMARRYWPGDDPIGKRIKGQDRRGRDDDWITVIGVVADTRRNGLDKQLIPHVYEWYLQENHPSTPDLVIRTTASPGLVAGALRRAVGDHDNPAFVSAVTTVDQQLSAQLTPRRFQMSLLTLFSLIALVLACAGIYGVMHYWVAQRTREIGIRVAIGAEQRAVLGLVIKEGAKLSLAGVITGIGSALILTRLIRSLLFGISATDPLTFVGISGFLCGVALLACYIPARRAMKVDPMTALRYE